AGTNCYFCHEAGHIAVDCAELAKTKCKKCAKLGHTQNFCNSVVIANKVSKQYSVRWSGKANRSEVPNWRKQVASVESTEIPETRPHCEVTVGENTVDGFVDTGAQITSLPDTVVENNVPLRSFTMADGKSVL